MSTDPCLERLEQQVMARISAHRQRRATGGSLPAGLVVTICALVAGLGAGIFHGRHQSSAGGSESVVLADDASLEPSTLLTRGP